MCLLGWSFISAPYGFRPSLLQYYSRNAAAGKGAIEARFIEKGLVPVRRWLKIAAWTVAAVLLLAGVAAVVFYRALHHVPEFYQQALQGDPVKEKAAGHEMQMRAG